MRRVDESPIILVGAGRSGTKLLRGLIASHPEVRPFPREINYIWRHGNASYPTDELGPEQARPEVIRYIRKRFRGLTTQPVRILEKTCANSLRVDFVRAVFPESVVIHLVRDGRAVSESARRMWRARPRLGYLMEKARWVPLSDVPYYAWRYFRYQVARFGRQDSVQGSWGPRFEGLDRLSESVSPLEVCGVQWSRCVDAADRSLAQTPPEKSLTLRYEDLVRDPVGQARKIFDRLQLSFVDECQEYARHRISGEFLAVWRERLGDEEVRLLLPHIQGTMRRHGYLD